MASPQEDYSYDELLHYLNAAETALANFRNDYGEFSVSIVQPEQDVLNDIKTFRSNYSKRLLEMNAYLDPDELDGLHIGSHVGYADEKKRKKIAKRIQMEKKSFLSDLSHLIRLHETQMRVLYMELSSMSAKFTADRMQELRRREKWVETQRHYFSLYHIKECSKWSAAKDIDLQFVTSFNDIPEKTGTYFLFSSGEIIYIGHSVNLHARLSNHEIVRKYYGNESGFDVECVYADLPINEAQALERKMIRLVKPRHNERGKI